MDRFTQLAQVSAVTGISAFDVNADGNTDLLLSGNFFPMEVETGRNDAGVGLVLTGDGAGNFTPVPLAESGFYTPHDARDQIQFSNGVVVVANNMGKLQLFKPAKRPL